MFTGPHGLDIEMSFRLILVFKYSSEQRTAFQVSGYSSP